MVIFFIIVFAICAGLVWLILQLFKIGKVYIETAFTNPMVKVILYIPLYIFTIICIGIIAIAAFM